MTVREDGPQETGATELDTGPLGAAVGTPAPGQQLGPFRVRAELGRGGMAVVYLADDPGLQRQVALKVVLPHLADNTQFMQRFIREARMAARLNHSHIVRIYGVDESPAPRYLVMEYLSGGTLGDIIRAEGPLSVERVVVLLRQVADALDYAHSERIVHRDVKPSNILLDANHALHLGDFGLARAWDSVDITTEGQVMGTVAYMAPEQAQGLAVDWRADLYALGVIAFEMLTGRVPFEGAQSVVLNQHISARPPSLHGLRQGLPTAVDDAVHRMLAKSPNERFQSGTQFVGALQHAVAGKEQSRGWGLPVLVVALAVVAGLVIFNLVPRLTAVPAIAQVSTFAGGTNQKGYADGAASAARFDGPVGVAVDRTGNVYVAEEMNDRIRKITPTGAVSTIGGPTGQVADPHGNVDGLGPNARFWMPLDLRVDQNGVVYVADLGNSAIRMLTPSAAGAYTVSTVKLTGAVAPNQPGGVAVNGDGSLIYVADAAANSVVQLTRAAAGTYTAVKIAAGAGGFKSPASVALDDDGTVYVADKGNDRILKLTRAGSGPWTTRIVQDSGLSQPGTLDVVRPSMTSGTTDKGALYIGNGDRTSPIVLKLTLQSNGSYGQQVVAGSGIPGSANGDATRAQFSWATGVAIGPEGTIYVADKLNHVIRKIAR